MKIGNTILHNHKKKIGRLKDLWLLLVDPKNFIIPETIDEFKQFGIFAPRIKIEPYGECFFNEKSRNCLKDFTNTIYEIPDIKDSTSYNFIYRTVKSFIERAILKQLKHSMKPDPKENIAGIIQELINGQGRYQFFRIIQGIKLEGLESLMMGNVEIFVFTDVYEKELIEYCEHKVNRLIGDSVVPFVKKNFLERVCIRTVAVGEEIRAREIATKTFEQVINILRFIVCLLRPETLYDNRVKINLLAESYNASENTIAINLDDKGISLSLGMSRKALVDLTIDAELLKELNDNCFLGDLLSILKNHKKTELEGNILTSIYWIGEAQNDFVYESAFIKYWTALETIFTFKEKVETKYPGKPKSLRITESLARGIAVFLVFGGYQFIKINGIEEVHKKVTKLYKKRGRVIHRGIYDTITPTELIEVCKYAVWSVLTCLELRAMGYKKLNEIRNETNRLYEASRSHPRSRNKKTRT